MTKLEGIAQGARVLIWPTPDLIALCAVVAILVGLPCYVAGVLVVGSAWRQDKAPENSDAISPTGDKT